MKKLFVIVLVSIACVAFAHPRHCGYRNDGVRLAADIVGLVGAGLNVLAPRTVVVQPTPVYTSPTYVAPAQTVVYPSAAPVYVQPIPRPIVSPVYDSRYVFPTYPVTYRTNYYYAPPPPPPYRPYRYYRRW